MSLLLTAGCCLSCAESDCLYGIKNLTVALQWVRRHVGDATIFCGRTMATSSRGVSYYSEGNTSEGNAGCRTTLLNVTTPKGHCTEGTSQALMRCCGEFGPALRPLLCDPAAAAICGCLPNLPAGHANLLQAPSSVPGAACATPALALSNTVLQWYVLQRYSLLCQAVSWLLAASTAAFKP